MIRKRWTDAPDWAAYMAMDSDGLWWYYERKPSGCNLQEWESSGGRCSLAGRDYKMQTQWEISLEERPK